MRLTPSQHSPIADADVIYPSGDGRPLAETPVHRDNLLTLIDVLRRRFADDPRVYVSGNMLMYYVQGDKRKHVSPDVFVVRGIPKEGRRDYYLVWEEGHGPDVAIELTSASTREEDLEEKKRLYQQTLGVPEYILFDPRGEYLDPPLQGFRLEAGKYVAIEAVEGRLPSQVLGLHFEGHGEDLRLYDPAAGRWLPTAQELLDETVEERDDAVAERDRATAQRDRAAAERDRATADNERLQQELAALRRRFGQTET